MDVMLAVDDTDGMSLEEYRTTRHLQEEVPLSSEVAIGPLTPRLREEVLDACEPRGVNCEPGIRQFGSLYGLVRRNAPDGSARVSWDPDHELGRVAAILRLVRPHTMSARDGARVITQPDGRREVCPARVEGPGSAAFVTEPDARWIRDDDVAVTRRLLESLASAQLPDRIKRAMFAHELLHWQYNVEVRWLLLVHALEGLVHTDESTRRPVMGQREQFVVRLHRLTEHIPKLPWSEDQLDAIYDHRNETMHGGDISALWRREAFPPVYTMAEGALRLIVREAVLRPALADVFATDDTVRCTLGTSRRV
jgi:hypothetical protein